VSEKAPKAPRAKGERVKLAFGVALLAVGVASGIWFTERLRVYPGPPLVVELGELVNESGDASLDGALELLLDEGRFVLGDDPEYALAGHVAPDGARHRIHVRVVGLATGEVLATAEGTASDEESIPRTLEELSAELRRQLARDGI
jgi:hypothetical protein